MSEPAATLTAIIVPLPELDPLVQPYRERYDAAYLGVPAHVTVLLPWIPPDELTESDLDGLAQLAKSWQPFDVSFGAFAQFEYGDDRYDVHYLAPEPADDFLALTEDLSAVWPEYQPYQGEYDVVPHLTVTSSADRDQANAIRQELQPKLPIATRVTDLAVVEVRDYRCSVRRSFRLGGTKR